MAKKAREHAHRHTRGREARDGGKPCTGPTGTDCPYGYLAFGVFLMFFPVVWLLLSSFKTEADLQRYPPTFLPYQQTTVMVDRL
jgi:ABC-type glycerol-3-phosphate transport system permease component